MRNRRSSFQSCASQLLETLLFLQRKAYGHVKGRKTLPGLARLLEEKAANFRASCEMSSLGALQRSSLL